jgi:hypothetical protein
LAMCTQSSASPREASSSCTCGRLRRPPRVGLGSFLGKPLTQPDRQAFRVR